MISMRLRLLYRRLSYLTALLRDFRALLPGIRRAGEGDGAFVREILRHTVMHCGCVHQRIGIVNDCTRARFGRRIAHLSPQPAQFGFAPVEPIAVESGSAEARGYVAPINTTRFGRECVVPAALSCRINVGIGLRIKPADLLKRCRSIGAQIEAWPDRDDTMDVLLCSVSSISLGAGKRVGSIRWPPHSPGRQYCQS